MKKMTNKEIANALAILNDENLLSLGFKNIGKTCDRYGGICYKYKNFENIRIIDFMGIRNLELYFEVCPFVSPEDLIAEGVNDVYKQYKIYDTVNEYEGFKIDIHSNEELVAICEKWAAAIKSAGIKKAKQREEYYKNL